MYDYGCQQVVSKPSQWHNVCSLNNNWRTALLPVMCPAGLTYWPFSFTFLSRISIFWSRFVKQLGLSLASVRPIFHRRGQANKNIPHQVHKQILVHSHSNNVPSLESHLQNILIWLFLS